jgi:hypothetical protein
LSVPTGAAHEWRRRCRGGRSAPHLRRCHVNALAHQPPGTECNPFPDLTSQSGDAPDRVDHEFKWPRWQRCHRILFDRGERRRRLRRGLQTESWSALPLLTHIECKQEHPRDRSTHPTTAS